MVDDDPDRFRKPAPIIALTPDTVAELNRLLDEVQKFASLNGLPWRRGASDGKPLLYGGEPGRGALLAYGTIGSWPEFDLAVAAVNALPALLATVDAGRQFFAQYDVCSPHITDAFLHRELRCGPYTGPSFEKEFKALRAAVEGTSNG